MPAKRKSKEKGQNITQTVKVIIGEGGKKKKRVYKRRPKKAKLDRGSIGAAPLTGPNTIVGEPYPIPPRILEVPTYYRISEGAMTSTGNLPSGSAPSVPAIMNAPQAPALMNAPQAPSLMNAPQATSLMNAVLRQEAPKEKSEEEKRIESAIEFGGLKPRSTFYKKYEIRPANLGGVGGTFEQTNPLLDKGRIQQDIRRAEEPIVQEPVSKEAVRTSMQQDISIQTINSKQSKDAGVRFEDIYQENPPEKITINLGSESKAISEFQPTEKPKSLYQLAVETAPKKEYVAKNIAIQTPEEKELKALTEFQPAEEKPKSLFESVISGAGSIVKSVAAGAVDTAIGAPPGTTASIAKAIPKATPKATPKANRPSWNVSESLQKSYIKKFKVSPEDAIAKLTALRLAYPKATSDEVKKAIRRAPSQTEILL